MSTGRLCLQARYNQWMDERLYAVTASLAEAVRRRDLGAFFKPLHGTFNHILLVDRLWIGRMTDHPCHFDSLDQELYRDFEQLRTQQRETDADLLHRVRALTAHDSLPASTTSA
ncbi:MAG: DinB family protein [Rhizobium sp.]|nr:DinB family protein [Rhizobium sp.]